MSSFWIDLSGSLPILRESKIIFDDWCKARFMLRSTADNLPDFGDLISHFLLLIKMSGDFDRLLFVVDKNSTE